MLLTPQSRTYLSHFEACDDAQSKNRCSSVRPSFVMRNTFRQFVSLLILCVCQHFVVTNGLHVVTWSPQSYSTAKPSHTTSRCMTDNPSNEGSSRKQFFDSSRIYFSRRVFEISTSLQILDSAFRPIKTVAIDDDLSLPQIEQLSKNGIAYRLLQKDPSLLKNRIFNAQPPAVQVYPQWMRGEWDITSTFLGFAFPSQAISKERLVQNANVPGFQKCSIASIADIGGSNIQYRYKIDTEIGLEDRRYNLENEINAFLKYPAISDVLYHPKSNPNRISIQFINYKTINAERIELFCNARESEEYFDSRSNETVFVCAEYIKQVTFGTGSTVGIPRQVSTNYAHFYSWKKPPPSNGPLEPAIRGNLLTAAYLDPQDPMYFDEPQLPVAVYSHALSATRR
jgi:hypothetical protein